MKIRRGLSATIVAVLSSLAACEAASGPVAPSAPSGHLALPPYAAGPDTWATLSVTRCPDDVGEVSCTVLVSPVFRTTEVPERSIRLVDVTYDVAVDGVVIGRSSTMTVVNASGSEQVSQGSNVDLEVMRRRRPEFVLPEGSTNRDYLVQVTPAPYVRWGDVTGSSQIVIDVRSGR